MSVRIAMYQALTHLREYMTSIVHYTEAAQRETPMPMVPIRRAQLLRMQLQVFPTLALAGVSHQHIMKAEREIKVFQQYYQFLIPKGSKDKLRKSRWKET